MFAVTHRFPCSSVSDISLDECIRHVKVSVDLRSIALVLCTPLHYPDSVGSVSLFFRSDETVLHCLRLDPSICTILSSRLITGDMTIEIPVSA